MKTANEVGGGGEIFQARFQAASKIDLRLQINDRTKSEGSDGERLAGNSDISPAWPALLVSWT